MGCSAVSRPHGRTPGQAKAKRRMVLRALDTCSWPPEMLAVALRAKAPGAVSKSSAFEKSHGSPKVSVAQSLDVDEPGATCAGACGALATKANASPPRTRSAARAAVAVVQRGRRAEVGREEAEAVV